MIRSPEPKVALRQAAERKIAAAWQQGGLHAPRPSRYTTCTLRPTRRLRLIICRPFLVLILARKPILRARLMLLDLCG